MAGRKYERLPIEQFGKHLLVSGDLDPVYIALHNLRRDGVWEEAQIKRWLVAYWCLYHCGAASYISAFEGGDFWARMHDAAENVIPAPDGGRWPRGHERRHWRGKQALAAWEELYSRYGPCPENMVDYIAGYAPVFTNVADASKEHRSFGPWISFKVGDMLDRCLGIHVDFTEAAVFMFKDPVQAALMLWREKSGLPADAKPKDKATHNRIIHGVVGHLESAFAGMTAPPLHDRPIELQEVETILCKWKSHMNGHYPLNNDIDEINAGLEDWGSSAAQFKMQMPERLPFEAM